MHRPAPLMTLPDHPAESDCARTQPPGRPSRAPAQRWYPCSQQAAWRSLPREGEPSLALHVHSNLPECLGELPAPPEPTLDSLALAWFGTA